MSQRETGTKRFRTRTGSVYQVDFDNKTWWRESSTAESGKLRTECGRFQEHTTLHPGTKFVMQVTDTRMVITSVVEEIL